MKNQWEKEKIKGFGRVLLSWLLSALLLLLLLALLAERMKLGAVQLERASALILALSGAAASAVLLRQTKGKRRLLSALLLALGITAVLLLLGFLILGDGVSARGMGRVAVSTALGTCLAAVLPQRGKQGRAKRQFGR